MRGFKFDWFYAKKLQKHYDSVKLGAGKSEFIQICKFYSQICPNDSKWVYKVTNMP